MKGNSFTFDVYNFFIILKVKKTAFVLLYLHIASWCLSQDNYNIPKYSAEVINTVKKDLKDARDKKDNTSLALAYAELAVMESLYSSSKINVFPYFERAKEYYKIIGDTLGYHTTNVKMATEYFYSGMYEQTFELLSETLEKCNSSICAHLMVEVHFLSALFHLKMNNVVKFENEFDLFQNSKNETPLNIVHSQFLKAAFFIYQNKYEMGLDLLENIPPNMLQYPISVEKELYISQAQLALGNTSTAMKTLNGLESALQPLPMNGFKLQLYDQKMELFRIVGKTNSALEYTKKLLALKDSINDRTRFETISTISEKYKNKQKNTEIKILELEKQHVNEKNDQQKRGLYVLGFLIAILASLIYFTVRFYTQQMDSTEIINSQNELLNKQKIQNLEDEVRLRGMHAMIEGQESERERISKDLHDSLGGLLSTIKLQVENIPINPENFSGMEARQNINSLLDLSVKEVRNISSNLQPISLKNLGLVAALNDLINRYTGTNSPHIEFSHFGIPKIDNMIALSVYRIVQELLNNSFKHAHAKEIFIQIRVDGRELILEYEDDGVGFDLENVKKSGMGLENITSRVSYIKGELHIDTKVGFGVSYLFNIPLS